MVGKNFPREVTPSKSVAQSYSTDSVRQLSEETSFEQPGLHDDVSQTRSPPPSNVRGCMTSRQASAPFNEAVDKLPKPETMPAPYSSRYGAQSGLPFQPKHQLVHPVFFNFLNYSKISKLL